MIRYNGEVLEPTGDFQTGAAQASGDGDQTFEWWHGVVIGVGGVLVLMVAITLVVIAVLVALKRNGGGTNPYREPLKVTNITTTYYATSI